MELKVDSYKTIEKMFPDIEIRIKIDQQLEKFKRGEGLFGMSMAITTRDKKQPGIILINYLYFVCNLPHLTYNFLSFKSN